MLLLFQQESPVTKARKEDPSQLRPAVQSDNDSEEGANVWRLAGDSAWKPCPFGMLPDGRYTSLEVV